MRRGRILILFALILLVGAGAAFLLLTNIGGIGGDGPAPEATAPPFEAEIVIAAQDIARGASIPPEGVILSAFPADWVVETMITDLNQVIGRRARTEIARGMPVTRGMITDQPGDLLDTGSEAAIAIPPGLTALAVPIDRFSGIAFALQDGDQVDVLMSMLMLDIDPDFQTELPNKTVFLVDPNGQPIVAVGASSVESTQGGFTIGVPEPPIDTGRVVVQEETGEQLYIIPDPEEQQRPRLVTQRLISNATVLHVGEFELPGAQPVAPVGGEQPQAPGAQQQPQQQGQPAPTPAKPDIVTLIVSPQEALALSWALESGAELTLTLRAPNDGTETQTASVTLQFLIDNYNISVPSRLPFGPAPMIDAINKQWTPSQAPATQVPVTQ